MNVRELNRDQLDELKWQVFCDPKQYGDFEYFHDITDEHIYKFFDGIDFVPDDFTTEI